MAVQLIQSVRRNITTQTKKQHEMKDFKMKTVKLVNTEQVVTHSPIYDRSAKQVGLRPSDVVVLGTGSNPVRADRRCLLPAIAELARQSSAKYHTAILKRL